MTRRATWSTPPRLGLLRPRRGLFGEVGPGPPVHAPGERPAKAAGGRTPPRSPGCTPGTWTWTRRSWRPSSCGPSAPSAAGSTSSWVRPPPPLPGGPSRPQAAVSHRGRLQHDLRLGRPEGPGPGEPLDAARQRLMDILSNYQGYKQCRLVLVFDGYKVKGGTPGPPSTTTTSTWSTPSRTRQGTCSSKKLLQEIGRNYTVRVATSDGLIQLSALRAGGPAPVRRRAVAGGGVGGPADRPGPPNPEPKRPAEQGFLTPVPAILPQRRRWAV